jgi:Zn2+/Cd2+-exporting ATPase
MHYLSPCACMTMSHMFSSTVSFVVSVPLVQDYAQSTNVCTAGRRMGSRRWAASMLVPATAALIGVTRFQQHCVQVMRPNIDAHVLMAVAGVSSLVLGMPFEGALLFVLFQLAHTLEARYVSNAQASVTGLLNKVPSLVTIVRVAENGHVLWAHQKSVLLADVVPGEHFIVKPGDVVPLDGLVVEGSAAVGELCSWGLQPCSDRGLVATRR